MAKKSKKKAPAKAKPVKAPAKPVPVEVPPPRVSFRPAKPTTRKSSVIMLSSAENSLCSEPSLILNEPSISIIDLARPSTRMSMEMDMTDLSDPRFSTRSPAGDDTDLSLTNIVQTPGVYRERPKSSWAMRRTRSKSMVPAPTVLEDVPEEVGERLSRNRATQSGEFSKVTRRARSVRPPARYLESIDENAVTKRAKNSRKKTVVEQEVESSLPIVTPAKVTTRRRNVAKDKIAEEVPIEPEVAQSSTVSTRRRNKPVQPDENHNHSEKEPETAATSVSQTTSEEDSNKSLETVSMVSVRRRRAIERPPSPEYPPEEPVFTQEPEPVQRPLSPEYPSEEPVFTQEPEPAPVVPSRGRQRRAVERIPAPEPNLRPRTRSAFRERQPILQQAPESASRPKRATKKVSKCPCCVNGQTHQESSPTTKARGRSRTRSEQPPVAQEKPAPKIRAGRSKSVMREPAPKTPPARSKSVSRESLSHVPVYRQQVAAPIEPAAVTAAKKQSADQDVYAFDSPGLLGVDSGSEAGKRKRKGAGNSTAKKKPRLGSSLSSRGKRVTPAKKTPLATAIFGTDMHRIGRVVQKIGGGPVKQPAEPMQTVNLDPLPPVSHSRPASPVVSNYDPVDDRDDNDQIEEPVIIPPSPPRPQVPPSKVHPLIERVLQQRPLDPAASPDRTQPPNVTLGFSPLGASSPWRVQNENVLPRTFYFSRSKDLLPSYESDVVVRDENVRSKTPVAEPQVSPVKPAAVPPITGAKADAMFRGIQQSYEQLKVTSEMSNKLITAMRKYKTTVHNQSVASISASGELPEDERLIAKFHEYEANMKKTYQKLKQWYERSQKQLTHSIRTIEQVSAVPKTLAQRQVLDNFRRDSKVFLTMINELESAMNDSNVENVSPRKVAPSDKPAFKDVVILTERNLANRNRSPLKTLEIANVPARFSPIKSPLVRSSFSAFASSKNLNKPSVAAPTSAIEIADTFAEPSFAPTEEQHPKKDLFGFETDDAEEASGPAPSAATPIKITKKTLKERLESVRKMLPPRPPSRGAFSAASLTRREPRMPKVIDGPSSSKPRSVQSVFASSTPVAKQKRSQTTRRGQLTEQDADLSAIADEPAQPAEQQPVAPSPPVALFDDVASTTLSAVNRTYSRIPRRNHKRKRNVYLADLGLSDDDDEEEDEGAAEQRHHNVAESEPEGDDGAAGKQAKKKRRVAASKKKKKNGVEETNEFKQFVNEFNSMCEEVDRYKLVIEKPAGGVRQRV